MNHLLFALLLAGLLLMGCTREIGPAKSKSSLSLAATGRTAVEPGVFDRTYVSKSGAVVRYTLSIPQGYDPDQPAPLIVALHFGGKVTPHYARGIIETLIVPGLSELSAIAVAPDSIAGPWTNEENEKMVLDLMDNINQQFNIDRDRTLLTGFSMGGHGTWYIGSRNQDRFSALIPVASAPMADSNVQWTTPIYVLHSRADTVVPIKATEAYVAAQRALGNKQIELVVVDDLPHFQTASFATPLKSAVPWVWKIWKAGPNEE